MKLHRIGNSKQPTIDQLKRMTENLHTVYPKSYANLTVNTMTYWDGSTKVEYWISVEGVKTKWRSSWSKTMAEYRRLMRKGTKNV